MKKVTMFSYCARWFLCDKRLFKDILHTTEVTVNTNSHSSEIKWWFWNDVLREEKKKEKAANTNSNFKKHQKKERRITFL